MTEIQNNLFGIKWPTGVDMPLNKTQTQTRNIVSHWFFYFFYINHNTFLNIKLDDRKLRLCLCDSFEL